MSFQAPGCGGGPHRISVQDRAAGFSIEERREDGCAGQACENTRYEAANPALNDLDERMEGECVRPQMARGISVR